MLSWDTFLGCVSLTLSSFGSESDSALLPGVPSSWSPVLLLGVPNGWQSANDKTQGRLLSHPSGLWHCSLLQRLLIIHFPASPVRTPNRKSWSPQHTWGLRMPSYPVSCNLFVFFQIEQNYEFPERGPTVNFHQLAVLGRHGRTNFYFITSVPQVREGVLSSKG